MIPIRFRVLDSKGREIKTTNPLNGSFGLATRGAQMGAAGRRKQHRKAALKSTVSTLKLAGLPVRIETVRACVRKGVVVREAYEREVIDSGAAWDVELVRISAGSLDDDAVAPALKSIRDGIADALAVNDGDKSRFACSYAQRKEGRGVFGVEVTIGIRAPGIARVPRETEPQAQSQFNLFQERK